ncbi:saccharopine dehydrogenase [NADP+, L-glutamate-forming] [Capronia epimyces CBS 606.96]|uniref:Saccharopine dehydrogenase [NADP(+), L-glutamate-forming] n=1 Tax=Capronia epimyces CBS 606.96 TaxID=1182542 RepID=W9Y7Z1_9EURO|nr:saccharopine dehydrogenase [NADP+, L-glutamate-forming] [Capronia epimyces CBS 606.96]EXJ88957.1 saccharopine dehydrogenase [NADP+, L-glutamate-forming] [Capronia epimyces CBS 606.96]
MPQSALLLGSGFVATPTVDLLANAGVHVTVACRTLAAAQKLAGNFPNTKAVSLDVNDTSALEAAVAQHDVTISLIPYTFHVAVVKAAIKAKKHVVTTSYVSPAMQALDAEAKAAGITVMNEIGLDPGIDHLYAIDVIDRVHKEGGFVRGFKSFCGGLPAPENSDNPLGYKFSWSSRGVLLALKNTAKFLEDGKEVTVTGEDLMGTAAPYHTGFLGFNFVAYGNRDSTGYLERYNIPEAQTVKRGTIRYAGFPEFVKVLVDIGFLRDEEQDFLKEPITWKEATKKILGATSSSENDLLWAISSKTTFKNTAEKKQLVAGLKWLGIFSDAKITPKGNALDTLCATLEEKMAYEEGERDLVFLQHRFDIENKDGSKDTITSTLCEYGAPIGSGGYSAMAKLVGIPCGVGKSSRVATVFGDSNGS